MEVLRESKLWCWAVDGARLEFVVTMQRDKPVDQHHRCIDGASVLQLLKLAHARLFSP